MYVNIRKGQEVLLAFPVDLFCIITILRHDIIACQQTCFIKMHHTYRDIHHNRKDKFRFFKSSDTCQGDCGKREDSRPHPFLCLGTSSRFLHQRRDRSRIRPAGKHQAGRCVLQAVDVEVRGADCIRKALGIWAGGTAAAWGGKTGKCPAFEFCCAFLICFSPWHREAPHWLFSNDTV